MQIKRNCFGMLRKGFFLMVLPLASTLFQPSSSRGQLPSHSYVPLEHWSMPYIEHLIRKRVLPDPLPMVRPFTVGDLQIVLSTVDSTIAGIDDLAMLERLRTNFALKDEWTGVTVEADVGLWAATHARRNSNLRESGDGHAVPQLGVNGVFQVGATAIVMHPKWDPNVKRDPDFSGEDRPIKGYYPDAYLAFRSRYVRADLGRTRRNWGPVGVRGLVVSSVPYPYDHFFAMIGTRHVFFHFLLADIDSMIDSNGELANRFFAAHRFTARLWEFLDLSLWGGQIIAGPGRQWELWFINPVPLQDQSRSEQNKPSNVIIGGDGELRLGDFRFAGSLSLDDLQLLNSPGKNDEPASFALTSAVDWSSGAGTYTLEYTLISNLSYRTNNPAESFLIDHNLERGRFGVGLTHNFTDYDLLTLRAGFLLRPGLLIKPELSLLRQGEGDPRLPFPPKESFSDLPSVHTGVVEKTFRASVQGDLVHASGIQVSFDAGIHRITDLGHLEGATDTRFVGSVYLRYKIGTKISLN